MRHKQRKKAWNDYQQELEEKKKAAEAVDKAPIEGSPSETPPAMVAAPAMPVEYNVYEPHRSDMRQLVEDKIKELTDEAKASLFAAVVQLLTKPKFQPCFAAVAKVLNKREIAASKDAQASLDKEWDKLLNKKTWDQERVKECRRVVDDARKKGEKVHIGRIFEVCTLLKVVSCRLETLKESIRVYHVFREIMCLMRIPIMPSSLRCHHLQLRWKPPRS